MQTLEHTEHATAPGLQTLDLVLGTSPWASLAASSEGRIVYFNAAARARWPELAAGDPLSGVFPAEARHRIDAAVAEVLAGGAPVDIESPEDGPARAQRWARFAISPLPGRAVLCIAADISELKRTEARLRRSEQLMVDTQGVAHLGTWEWDVSEPVAVWSEELYRIYGLTPDTYTPSYENYLAMVHPDDRQRVIDATNRVFHEHVPYSHDERIILRDGSQRYLHTWAHPVLDEGGNLVRLVGVCQDITEQKRAEAAVLELNQDLERRVAERTRTIEQSLRDVEAFNAMVSHDLRAPLQVITMTCQLMAMDGAAPLPPRFDEHLARMRRSADHMTQLVNDLLSLAHVGNAALERSDVDLSALAAEIVANLRRLSPERLATVDIQPGLRCHADPVLLRSVMENLLGNAWKYSSRVEHARIEVGSLRDQGRTRFFVRDNGAGFDATAAGRLFKPFERLHKATEFAGTGVGLAVVQRIIERHQGNIEARGEPGKGAVFTFDMGG